MVLTKSFLLSLCLCLAVSSSLATAATVALMQESCDQTKFPAICTKYLSQKPESRSADMDVHGLAELAIREAAEVGADAATFISKSHEAAINDSLWQQCLNDCSECYIDAVEQLDDCTGAMETKKYADVSKWLDAAVADAQTCMDSCKDSDFPEKANLFAMNEEFSNMCTVVLNLVNLIPK